MYLILFAVGLVSLYLVKLYLNRASPRAPLPPGPKGLPLIGNLRDLPDPALPDWPFWLKLKDRYGPISTLAVPGQRLIILNDTRAASEMLDKKSLIYSDRPQPPFATLCGMGDTALMQVYGKRLKSYRTHIHHQLGSNVNVASFNQAQSIEVRRFLLRMLDAPEDLRDNAAGLTAAFILRILYGYQVDYTRLDPLMAFVKDAVDGIVGALVPGAWTVDAVPALKYLPGWFPGAGFQREAQQLRAKLRFLADLPFEFVKDRFKAGDGRPSYVSNLLKDKDISAGSEEESEIKWTAVSLYFAGADTTVSTVSSFFLAMILHPDVQKRAQEEIDRVVGRGRLPDFADRDRLPFINALVKEALRWHPVTPMGVVHTLIEDDIHDGYHIPKGSIIIPNVWAFCHDPNVYKDPMTFSPDRFLGDNPEPDPGFVFGYGRRICPGRFLADANIYLTIATSLAAFNINKKIRNSKEVDVEARFTPGIVSHPALFEMALSLRDAQYGELVRAVEDEHPWVTTDADIVRDILNTEHWAAREEAICAG